MTPLSITKYWELSGLIKNWLTTVPIATLKRKFKENEQLKQKYFILRDKKRKWITLSSADRSAQLKFSNIIWGDNL